LLRESNQPIRKRLWVAFIVTSFSLIAVVTAIVIFGGDTVAYESPKYRVVHRLSDVELREYEPYVVAETAVDGDLESAGNRGFRILARYIFGDNQGKGSERSPRDALRRCATRAPGRNGTTKSISNTSSTL
jgi:hypothetical protein